MSEISLTASMRSNLLSLQQIAKLQDSTQLRLSTGLKVNSAIDNPSSYYTASSLNNRAEDLSALLDSMGQSVQTIKAATEGIEKAEDLLSQMKAIAEQVNTGVYVPEKSYFEKLVGANGAVVTTADELRAAVDSGKEEICVYGKIDLGDISTSGGLELQANQKLVGVNYYGNFGTEGEEFSSISATSTAANNMIDIKKTGCLVSDLNLNYENKADINSVYTINISNKNTKCEVNDLTINVNFFNSANQAKGAISIVNNAMAKINGKINIESIGKGEGITGSGNSTIDISSNAQINIKTTGNNSFGISSISNSNININSGARINIETSGTMAHAFYIYNNSNLNIESDVNMNIKIIGNNAFGIANGAGNCSIGKNSNINIISLGSNSHALHVGGISQIKIDGNISMSISRSNSFCFHCSPGLGGGQIAINPTALIYCDIENSIISSNGYSGASGANVINIVQGVQIAVEKDGNTKWYEVKESYRDENTSTTTDNKITADNIETTLNVSETNSWKTAADVVAEKTAEEEKKKAEQAEKEAEEQANREVYQKQYNNALSQYDSLIKDSSYKGVNLLQADDLKVIFNENRSSTLDVQGVDLSSDKIGMMTADWTKAKDVQTSLEQVINAKNTLRSASTKLGNYYSIITERETFTDNLINVLEEGADKLTLADMNEESANMLSLQTQQQLAINSLSLASQASQAVLRLF